MKKDRLFSDTGMFFSGVVLAMVSIGYTIYFQPRFIMQYIAKMYHQVFWFAKTSESVCALTIDDAPSASTAKILDVLKKHRVRATFFILSDNIPGNEHLLERMVREGHQLGNHLTQDKASISYSPAEFERHLLQCHDALLQYQPCVKWIRPGSGWFNQRMIKTAKKYDYRICLGNVYPHDAQIKFESVNEFYLRKQTTPGSIVIVHDRQWTVGVLEKALPILRQRFRFLHLNELQHHESVR